MPYPHKNTDGILPKPYNAEEHLSVDDFLPKPPENIDEWWEVVKQNKFKAKVLGTFSNIPNPPVLGATQEKLQYLEKLWKDKAIPHSQFEEIKKQLFDDPVLIPATEKYTPIWIEEATLPTTSPQIKVMHTTLSIDIDGIVSTHKIGSNFALNPMHDYTESEIRQMLEQGFKKIADLFISKLKENNK